MRLKDQVAIVTGAAQGLGEAIVHRLAAEGCRGITIADIKIEAAQSVANTIERDYPHCRALALHVNVTQEDDVVAMVEQTVAAFGQLDILVANAGILKAHDITEFPADEWRAVINVNLFGYFLCAREAAKVMVAQKRGSIIQINSKSGKKGSFRNSAYAASKFGGIGLTQSIALDLAPHNVRVNAICPGNLLDGTLWQQSLFEQYARTQGLSIEEVRRKYESQVPLGRACTYDDVCHTVVFLASEEASYFTGQALNVAGGQEMH
jgi:sorbitol-6-phosphate 2-dehydrogenase